MAGIYCNDEVNVTIIVKNERKGFVWCMFMWMKENGEGGKRVWFRTLEKGFEGGKGKEGKDTL